jgi:PAS domain S-box-containing protein
MSLAETESGAPAAPGQTGEATFWSWEWSPVTGTFTRLKGGPGKLLEIDDETWLREPGLWLERLSPRDRVKIASVFLDELDSEACRLLMYRARTTAGVEMRVRHQSQVVVHEGARLLSGEFWVLPVAEDWRDRTLTLREALNALDAIPAVVAFMDRDLRLRLVNYHCAAARGRSVQDFEGLTFRDLYGDECVAMVREQIDAALAGLPVSFEIPTKDGRQWFHTFYTPHHDAEGRVDGFLALATDITQLKSTEAALRASQLELRERMSELAETDRRKDQFLAMLGHELRTPLASISNTVAAMRLGGAPDPASCELLQQEVQHMSRILEDLLDVSRITRGQVQLRRERVSLKALVDASLRTMRAVMRERRQSVTLTLPDRPVELLVDPLRLQQVLSNLLHNATKYTDAGGHIWVTAGEVDGEVVISVRDDGIGIEPELLPRVFDVFTQGEAVRHRSQGGMGIGLTLVRHLVQLHSGTVEARSEGAGKGSELVVKLPRQSVFVLATEAPPVRAPESSSPDGLRVLIVDDNRNAAVSLAKVTELLGHRASVLHDGPSALSAIAELRPDVVLLDLGMPEMDGYCVARELTANGTRKDFLLAAMTGYGQPSDRDRTREAGFDVHLVKPAPIDALEELFRKGAARRAAGAVSPPLP